MQKTLYRLQNGRLIAGVCAGLAEYLNIDVSIIRILCVLFGCSGLGILAYLACAVLLPEKP